MLCWLVPTCGANKCERLAAWAEEGDALHDWGVDVIGKRNIVKLHAALGGHQVLCSRLVLSSKAETSQHYDVMCRPPECIALS